MNCDCGRFMEIGNNVFMAYKRTEQGFEELEQKNVDFGGGLERMAAATINDPDVFKIDTFYGIIQFLEEKSRKKYGENEEMDIAFLQSEIPKSIEQALEGVARISKIVCAMKEFSHPLLFQYLLYLQLLAAAAS